MFGPEPIAAITAAITTAITAAIATAITAAIAAAIAAAFRYPSFQSYDAVHIFAVRAKE